MNWLLIAAFAGLFAGLVTGAMTGAWYADKKLRARLSALGAEIARMRAVAEEKLAGDDPDLPALMRNLQDASEQARGAIAALENQAALTRRKSAGGREVVAASRRLLKMIEEMGGDTEALAPPAPTLAAPKASRPAPPRPAAAE